MYYNFTFYLIFLAMNTFIAFTSKMALDSGRKVRAYRISHAIFYAPRFYVAYIVIPLLFLPMVVIAILVGNYKWTFPIRRAIDRIITELVLMHTAIFLSAFALYRRRQY